MANKTMKTLTIGNDIYEIVDETARNNIRVMAENAVQIDTTLSQSGYAADSKIVGDQINSLSSEIDALTPEIIGALNKNNVVNNLTTTDSGYVLDARQGKLLNENKIETASIVNNLTTNDSTKVLSAAQGVAVDTRIKVFEDAMTVSNNSIDVKGKYIDNALFR